KACPSTRSGMGTGFRTRSRAKKLQPAEPIVAAVLPVAAGVIVEDRQPDHMLGVLEAQLGRHADAHGKAKFGRERLAVELEGHLSLRMQRSRHVDRNRITFRTGEV